MSERAVERGWIDAVLDRLEAPPGAWAFALRIWLAMVLALYVAFWLQLESASSAAVCVAILAQPKRGQALSKAFYRFFGTVVGFAVAIVLAGLFGQDRVLLLTGFGLWLGLCVFTANYLQGTRTYGAMLSGYTVAIIAIANIDAPQNVFSSGIERVAAITVGIVVITFINDALGAPAVFDTVRASIVGARQSVDGFVRAALGPERPSDGACADVTRAVAATRADIAAIVGEFGDGTDRAAGARSAVAGLFAQIAAARGFARAAFLCDPDEVAGLRARVLAGLDGAQEARDELESRVQALVAEPGAAPERVLLHRRAADILHQHGLVEDGVRSLDGGGPPCRDVDLPVHRDFPDALRNAARVVVAYAVSAVFFILSGWPATSNALLQVSATAALSSVTPSPRAFATGVLMAMPIAVICAGVAKFLVLDGGQGFPLLAIALAPPIIVGCFLSLRPKTFTLGFILIVFFPVVLSPSNPQSYDPQSYLNTSVQFLTAAALLFVSIYVVLPTSDAQRRRWSLRSARADILEALRGEPKEAGERVNLDSDRLAQFAGRQWASDAVRRAGLRHAFALAGLDTAAAGAQAALNRLAGHAAFGGPVEEARDALARLDAPALDRSTRALLCAVQASPEALRRPVSLAVADLAAAALLVRSEHRVLRRFGLEGHA